MGFGSFLKSAAGAAVGSGLDMLGSVISDKRSAKASQASWNQNYNAQKEFAQNSIQWRVQDAKKAGINPYAVVGGQSVGYTPQDISQTQDYGSAVSRIGNRIQETLGQLQLATAKEDLKSKKLDNDKKSVELLNSKIQSNMGQVPRTLTPVVKGSDGGLLQTFGDGTQIIRAEQSSGIDEPFGFANEVSQRFDRSAHKANSDLNSHYLALGPGGYSTIPKNKELSAYEHAKIQAAEVAPYLSELGSVLAMPAHIISAMPRQWLKQLIRKFKKGGK